MIHNSINTSKKGPSLRADANQYAKNFKYHEILRNKKNEFLENET